MVGRASVGGVVELAFPNSLTPAHPTLLNVALAEARAYSTSAPLFIGI